MSPDPARLQTAGRLVALQRRITVLFTALNVAGLIGMGTVAAYVDNRQRHEALDADLRITANTVTALIYREAGTLRLSGVGETASGTTTGLYVFELRGAGLGPAFARHGDDAGVDMERLRPLATTAMNGGLEVTGEVQAVDGTMLRMLAIPFEVQSVSRPTGVVITTADPRPAEGEHRLLLGALFGGGAAFALLCAFGGHLIARRSTRPGLESLAQQEQFLADAAHELRNPLAAIRAGAETMIRDPDRAGELLPRIVRSADRLTASVEALLTRARMVAGTRTLQKEPFRLDQLVEEVVTETVRPPNTVGAKLPATIAHGDPAVVRIAVRNLIENAVRHGRTDGRRAELTVSVHPGEVVVADRGPGPGADPRVLTGRFRSGSADGTGLGLAIVDWVARLHQGRLDLIPRPGGGTIARLRLPEPERLSAGVRAGAARSARETPGT
ncbi:sensor histidine kinase [Catenuloplanes indicus]|uniref:Sensor-like histidine kinase SenX3 n=1 Tax=Catenuloplanes indicus TaxID=137267 RepID=A0AAE3W4Z4_9ACTN|nr:HAMP domain-containing sensor histidine kinase [Catenuloplanes indicus]MDQ0369938.1 signal transduction histidine kinase [Catenuloplanes indicus]